VSVTEDPQTMPEDETQQVRRPPVRPLAVVAILAVLGLVVAVVVLGLTGGATSSAVSVEDQAAPSGDPVALLDIEVIGVDVARGVQQLLVLPIPQTESGLFSVETRLVVERDGLPPTIVTFAPGATIFPAQVEVAAVGGRNDYPWDTYQSQLRLSLDEGAGPLPVEAEVDTSLSGWRIDAALATTGTDTITFTAQTTRALGSVGIATLQFVAILAMALLLAAVVIDNVQKRRATWMSIFWSLLVTISLTSLRGLMPGSPPLGVKMDAAFTFPALLIIAVVVISFVSLYLTRWVQARVRGQLPDDEMAF
jgi:hypothetical protein